MPKLVMVNKKTQQYLWRRFWIFLLIGFFAFGTTNCVERIGSKNRKNIKSAKKSRNNFYRGRDPYKR